MDFKKMYNGLAITLSILALGVYFSKVILIARDVQDIKFNTTVASSGTLKNRIQTLENLVQERTSKFKISDHAQDMKIQKLEILMDDIKKDTELILKKLDAR